MQNGVQIKICPKIIVNKDRSNPSCMITTKSDTPIMISGSTMGSMMKPMMERRAGKAKRVEARAARTPKIVETTAVVTAIIRLLRTATCSASVDCSTSNHFVVNPFNGKDTMLLSLKAKTGKRMAGA